MLRSTVRLLCAGLCISALACGCGTSPEGPAPMISGVGPATGTLGEVSTR